MKKSDIRYGKLKIHEKKEVKNILKRGIQLTLLMSLVFFNLTSFAQNQIILQATVAPPYSPNLSYYLDNPNKLIITFTNTTSSGIDFYLHAKFASDDAGIAIETADNYKPSQFLHLNPYETYQATAFDMEGIFPSGNLNYTGITQQELINQQAVPEGNYQFCFQAFDFQSDEIVSQYTCSNIFPIQYVDPPIILSPFCGDSITETQPQNVIISWSFPVGATPGNVEYNLQMVEMFPDERDPNDALASAAHPLFLDLTTNINSYIIGPADLELIPDRSYAFLVKAEDKNGEILFRNNGKSEACWFRYKSFNPLPFDSIGNDIIDLGIGGFLDDFEFLPFTSVSGQLLAKTASAAGVSYQGGSTSGGNQGGGGFNYFDFTGANSTPGGNSNNNDLSVLGNFGFGKSNNPANNLSFQSPFGVGEINATVLDIGGAEPLRNTDVRLVQRFSLRKDDGFFETRTITQNGAGGTIDIHAFKFYNLDGTEISTDKVLASVDKVLDVCTTDNLGNYSFDFQTDFLTGPVYLAGAGEDPFLQPDYYGIISLKVEVINQKFCSPDVDIFSKPGAISNIPPQLALMKDFELFLTVVSEFDSYDNNTSDTNMIINGHDLNDKSIPGGDPIPNAMVKVLRDVQALKNEHPEILLAEGQQLGTTTNNENGEFKDVFIGVTDSEGKISIPRLIEHWEPVDGKNQSPYFFSVRTRSEQADSAYENTIYNFYPFFDDITGIPLSVDAGSTTLLDDDAGFSGDSPVVYNHFYSPPSSATDREVRLMAAPPEIKGRVMVESNLENIGLKEAKVELLEGTEDITPMYERSDWTNDAGFFRFKDLPVFTSEDGIAIGPHRRTLVTHALYEDMYRPKLDAPAVNLKYGELYFQEFQLVPKNLLKGKVVDEEGNAVSAYLRVLETNPYVKTEPTYEYDENGNIYVEAERFKTPADLFNNRIEIIPLSGQYFPDTLLVHMPSDKNKWISLTVYKKLHRLKLQVKNSSTNAVISNADVVVGDTLAFGKTDENGFIELTFPSPGEQFLVKVAANAYSPTQVSFNIPVSSAWTYKTLGLEPAMSISGVITEKQSKQPIDSALVYIRLQSTDGHAVYLESYSQNDGKYNLTGIPMTLTTVDVHVVKEGNNPSYIGTSKTINVEPFAYPTPSYDFQLTSADGWDLSNIWGFPVSIEQLGSKNGTDFLISGYLHNLPGEHFFNTLNANEKVYFKNIGVTKNAEGKIEPKQSSITTETFSVPVKINGGFEGKLFIPSSWVMPQHLKLEKNGAFGKLQGAMSIDLASFKFAYDFHGNFYLGNDTTINRLVAFRSKGSGGSGFYFSKLYIFNLNTSFQPIPINNFKVFGFNASSSFNRAFYQDEAMHIGTILHTDIPMASGQPSLDLKINAGEIKITREDIDVLPNSNNFLSFNLEKWKVESNSSWSFDKTRDAIVIPKGLILTGLGVDASIKGLLVRPTALREGEIDMEGGLSLGGVAILTMASGIEPVFNFDAGVGHYRISMVGNASGPVAWFDKLPATNDRLDFNSIGMLSDNSSVLSLGKHMLFHNILDIYVDQVMTGNSFFQLAGMPELDIPGFLPSRAVISFKKTNGQLHEKLESIAGLVDLGANTVYNLGRDKNSQTLTNKKYTAYGEFFIKPPPGGSGSKLKVKGFLTKTPNYCKIDVLQQDLLMGKETMDVFEGNISVSNNSWGNLFFNAHTNSQGVSDDNIISYKILGGIEANGDDIKVDKIDTPLGDLNMAYLFPEKALVGDLTITANLNMGFASLKSGQMGMRFDPYGFYMGFQGNITISSDDYSGGFLLGVYSENLNNFAQPMLAGFETSKPDFSSLHGFYAIGQRTLIDKSFNLVGIDIAAKAGLGAFVHFDYVLEKFQVGGYGFAKLKGGIDVPLCGFVGVHQNAYMDVKGTYLNGDLSISTCSTLETCVGACGLEGCLNLLSRMKITNHSAPDVTLQLGGDCSNYND